jgi:hypothetical protein
VNPSVCKGRPVWSFDNPSSGGTVSPVCRSRPDITLSGGGRLRGHSPSQAPTQSTPRLGTCDQLDPCKGKRQFDNINNAPPCSTGSRCDRALPDGRLAATSLPRSSRFVFALSAYPCCKLSVTPQSDVSAHLAPPQAGVAGGNAFGVGNMLSAVLAAPFESKRRRPCAL